MRSRAEPVYRHMWAGRLRMLVSSLLGFWSFHSSQVHDVSA